MNNEVLSRVRRELKQASDSKARESASRFFKESITLYGVKMPVVSAIAKKNMVDIKDSGKSAVFDHCEELWQSGLFEESIVACHWSYAMRRSFVPEDFKVFDHWVNQYVSNWATCDTFCNHTVGTLVEMYPDLIAGLKKWAHSKNRWVKRAAAVSLIVPGRNGNFLPQIFQIADLLLEDADDLVQKGYGWMLKAASAKHELDVFDFVMERRAVMPRTALRYAIEKMGDGLRKRAMGK